jgi:hypothetical protein
LHALLFDLRGQQLGLLLGLDVWAARFSVSFSASSLRVAHCAVCSFSCTRRCSTRWRPSTTKRISASSRPTSALAS